MPPVSVHDSSGKAQTGGKCVLVSLRREGTWQCHSCTTRGFCLHKPLAQDYARGSSIIDKACQSISTKPLMVNDGEGDLSRLICQVPSYVENPISHLLIPVPHWAPFVEDTVDYTSRPPEDPLSHFPLDRSSRCCCGSLLPPKISEENTSTQFIVFGL